MIGVWEKPAKKITAPKTRALMTAMVTPTGLIPDLSSTTAAFVPEVP